MSAEEIKQEILKREWKNFGYIEPILNKLRELCKQNKDAALKLLNELLFLFN